MVALSAITDQIFFSLLNTDENLIRRTASVRICLATLCKRRAFFTMNTVAIQTDAVRSYGSEYCFGNC